MMKYNIIWRVHFKDGSTITQIENGKENPYSFVLFKETETPIIALEWLLDNGRTQSIIAGIPVPEGSTPILSRRHFMNEEGETIEYLIGVEKDGVQSITYVTSNGQIKFETK